MAMITPQTGDLQMRGFKSALDNWIATQRAHASSRELADLYHTSVWCYVAANWWAQSVATTPMKLVGPDGNAIEGLSPSHPAWPVFDLLQQPDFYKTMRRTEITLRFWGYSMSRKVYNIYDNVRALDWVNPTLYTKVEDGLTGIMYFLIYPGKNQPNPTGRLSVSDAWYIHEYLDFHDDTDGVSSAEVAFLQASAGVELAMSQLAFFQNMAIPAMVVQPMADTLAQPSEADANFLRDWFQRVVQGARNAGKTLISQVRWDFNQLQASWKDNLPTEQDRALRETVAAAFDLPVEFLTTGQTTFAELEGKINLWNRQRFVPRMMWYAQELTSDLCREYPGYRIEPDFTDVLKADERERTELAERKAKAAFISLADMQRELKIDPPEQFEDLYWYQDVGWVPLDRFANVWKNKLSIAPSVYNVEQITGEPLPAPASPDQVIPTETATGEIEAQPLDDAASAPAPDAIAADDERVPDRVYKEIDIAARKASKSQTFTPDTLHAATVTYIEHLTASGIERADVVTAAKAHWLRVSAAKAIQATRLDYELILESLFDDAVAGGVTKARFRTILSSQTDRAIDRAFRDGLADGGVNIETDADMSADDLEWIEAFKAEQRQYFTGVIEAIYEDDRVSETEAANKPEMWFNKSVFPAYTEGLASASRNAVYEWVLGDAEHCQSCLTLSGQRRRMSFWKRTVLPKDDRLQCAGFRCACNLTPTDRAVSRGKLPRWQFAKKHVHDEDGEPCQHDH